MRIAIGQLWQETNTFNPLPTTFSDFEAFGVLRGEEILTHLAHTNEPGGFIQSLRAWPENPEIVGLVRLPAWPSGIATTETFDRLCEEMLSAIDRAGKIDAVLLALHGALVSETEPDVEGALLERIRQQLPGVPLVATLDLHANLTTRMVNNSDALVLYHTAPHIDVYETGVRAAGVLRRILVDGCKPIQALVRIPAVMPAERANTQDPTSVSFGLCRRLRELEQDLRILAAGLTTVQPWLDIPDLASTALVVTDNDPTLAKSTCNELATKLWNARREYLPELVDVKESVRIAHEQSEGLVVLSDSADATTSGAPGDSNHVLQELLRYTWRAPALVTMVDPDLVKLLQGAEEGYIWEGLLGGKRDHRFSQPFPVRLEFVRTFQARFIMSGHLGKNLRIDMGPSVVLRHGEVYVFVTARSGPHFAPELFISAGFDPFDAAVVVAKSPCGFRAVYATRAAKIMVVRAPGCAPSDFWNYRYLNIPRPLWPWDDQFQWPHQEK